MYSPMRTGDATAGCRRWRCGRHGGHGRRGSESNLPGRPSLRWRSEASERPRLATPPRAQARWSEPSWADGPSPARTQQAPVPQESAQSVPTQLFSGIVAQVHPPQVHALASGSCWPKRPSGEAHCMATSTLKQNGRLHLTLCTEGVQTQLGLEARDESAPNMTLRSEESS